MNQSKLWKRLIVFGSLSQYLVNLRNGEVMAGEDEIPLMRQLIKEYGSFSGSEVVKIPSTVDLSQDDDCPEGDVVVSDLSISIGLVTKI